MLRTSCAIAFLILQALLSTANASPISYDFSGNFSAPLDGSTQFSGRFTYDSNLPLYPNANQSPTIAYYGSPAPGAGTPISITFTSGGLSSSDLGTITNSELAVRHDASYDELTVYATYTKPTGQSLELTIGLLNFNNQSPGPFTSVAPPAIFSAASFNAGPQFIYNTFAYGNGGPVVGTITSLYPTGTTPPPPNIPEPTTLSIFLVASGGLILRKYFRPRG